ncbi:hypothetical protein EG347_08075 [Chryseobacterium sp. G0186]|nr:hypothetical protein EG347_08075 [Chryseobacterium sp. G0186]
MVWNNILGVNMKKCSISTINTILTKGFLISNYRKDLQYSEALTAKKKNYKKINESKSLINNQLTLNIGYNSIFFQKKSYKNLHDVIKSYTFASL